MTSGKYKCFICNKKYSLGRNSKNPQSTLKRATGEYTQVSKQPIYEHACLKCAGKQLNQQSWGKSNWGLD